VWRYLFQPDGDGALVTESYEVTRPVSRLGWFIIGRLYGRHDRRADLRAGMEHTLHRIRESAESGAHLVANGDVRRGEHVAVPRVDFAGVLDVHVVAAPGCARRPILVATIAFGFDVATHSHDDTPLRRHGSGFLVRLRVHPVSSCLFAVSVSYVLTRR